MNRLKEIIHAISLPFWWLGVLLGCLFMVPVFAAIACLNGMLVAVLWATGRINEIFDDPFEQNN